MFPRRPPPNPEHPRVTSRPRWGDPHTQEPQGWPETPGSFPLGCHVPADRSYFPCRIRPAPWLPRGARSPGMLLGGWVGVCVDAMRCLPAAMAVGARGCRGLGSNPEPRGGAAPGSSRLRRSSLPPPAPGLQGRGRPAGAAGAHGRGARCPSWVGLRGPASLGPASSILRLVHCQTVGWTIGCQGDEGAGSVPPLRGLLKYA